jgi:uncharacterized membrane protein
MDGPGVPRPKKTSVVGTIALVVVLLGLLIAASLFAVRSWTAVEGPPMPGVGYVAMTIGVVLSLAIGIALMALLFYSSRHGYDERAARDAAPTPTASRNERPAGIALNEATALSNVRPCADWR